MRVLEAKLGHYRAKSGSSWRQDGTNGVNWGQDGGKRAQLDPKMVPRGRSWEQDGAKLG